MLAFAQPNLAPRADSLAKVSSDPLDVADAYSVAWQYDKEIEVLQATGRSDAEVLWRLARSHVDIGENLTSKEALKKYEIARGFAEKAVALDSNNTNAQQMLAITLGREAQFEGLFKDIVLAKRIYAAAHRAVALNDSMPRSLFILGKLHEEISENAGLVRSEIGCSWARLDSVTYYYDATLKVNPRLIQTRVQYAKFLLKTKGDREKVRRLLEEALGLPVVDEQDGKAKEEAGRMLGKEDGASYPSE